MSEMFHEHKERAGACADCGNSPVNHFETYILHSLGAWLGSSAKKSPRSGRVWMRRLERAVERGGAALAYALTALGITRFGKDPSAAATYRSQVIWEEAARRGIEMEQLILLGSPTEIYRARIASRWAYFQSIPIPPRFVGDRSWIDDKWALKRTLARLGVPAPIVRSVTSEKMATEALREMGGAVVVKPQVGSRARHTAVNVRDEADALEAFRSARRLCRYVVMERYLEGSVCRATFVGGTLRGFFQGDAPRVVGDGVSTIGELIHAANSARPDRVGEIVVSEEHERFLTRFGQRLDSVPGQGAVVALSHRTGRLFGGRTRELLGKEHPKLRAYLQKAADALDVPIIGFDLIIRDPEADPDTQEWGIIEANSLPYIDLHSLPLYGEPSNVAAAVWDLWNDTAGDVHTERSTAHRGALG
jgi:D-alanine-D-alanine ligase-like ATP-grasp enzyme